MVKEQNGGSMKKLKDINKMVDEESIDSILSKTTRLFKKHWLILIVITFSFFCYKAYNGYVNYNIKSKNYQMQIEIK